MRNGAAAPVNILDHSHHVCHSQLEAQARTEAAALEREIAGKQRDLQELSSSTDREQQEMVNSRRRMQATTDSKVEGLGALTGVKAAKLMIVGG